MKNILCYGDSNTYGFNPDGGRYKYDQRWTGILAEKLGKDYFIVQEGLNGRTCDFVTPNRPYLNACDAIGFLMLSHMPLDCIFIMLGTNDCKDMFQASADDITKCLEKLVKFILEHEQTIDNKTQVVILTPVPMDMRVTVDEEMTKHSVVTSENLAASYKALAEKLGVGFENTGEWGIEVSWDGCHYSKAGHAAFAEHMEKMVAKYCK